MKKPTVTVMLVFGLEYVDRVVIGFQFLYSLILGSGFGFIGLTSAK